MISLIWVMNTCGMYYQRRKSLCVDRFSRRKNWKFLQYSFSFGSQMTDITTHHKTVFLEWKKDFYFTEVYQAGSSA